MKAITKQDLIDYLKKSPENLNFNIFNDMLDDFKGTYEKDLAGLIGREITSINIPQGTKTIGVHAFDGCNYLRNITIPDSVNIIGENAFNYCNALTDVYYTGTEEQWNAIEIYDGNASLTNATIHYNYIPE